MFGRIRLILFIIGDGEIMAAKLKAWQIAGNQLGARLAFGKKIAREIGGIQVRQ